MAKKSAKERFTVEVAYSSTPMSPEEFDAAVSAIAHLMALAYLADHRDQRPHESGDHSNEEERHED